MQILQVIIATPASLMKLCRSLSNRETPEGHWDQIIRTR
jgi:hypothetical protein